MKKLSKKIISGGVICAILLALGFGLNNIHAGKWIILSPRNRDYELNHELDSDYKPHHKLFMNSGGSGRLRSDHSVPPMVVSAAQDFLKNADLNFKKHYIKFDLPEHVMDNVDLQFIEDELKRNNPNIDSVDYIICDIFKGISENPQETLCSINSMILKLK